MNTDPDHTEPLVAMRTELRDSHSLVRLHGHEPLASTLGHRSTASLRQAQRRGQVTIPMFAVPNRWGWFALTLDVADWLVVMRASASAKEGVATRP